MKEILLPIKPKYVNKILEGSKQVEYRSWIPSCGLPFKVYIYSSFPIRKIVGSFKVNSIISAEPETVWGKTHNIGGVSAESFFSYFKDKDIAYAYEISEVEKFTNELDLSSIGLCCAPQKFLYVNSREFRKCL